MKRDDIHTSAESPAVALARINRAMWALENARPMLVKTLRAGPDQPFYAMIVAELRNLAWLLNSLPLERDETGFPLHMDEIRRGAK